MTYPAEAQIAREIMKFAANGLLYRGSKPVMWSVVEKTALAEAEVEYEDHASDAVTVAFPAAWSPSAARATTAEKSPGTSTASSMRTAIRSRCHLDDDAVDAAGQSRHRLLASASPTASIAC